MDHDRQLEFGGEFEVGPQCGFLRLGRRMQVVEIEATFSDGDDFFRLGELAQRADSVSIAILRIMRMHPDHRIDMRIPFGDFDGAAADGKTYASKFTGKYDHRILNGIGHNVPQEDPQAFAKAIVDVDGY